MSVSTIVPSTRLKGSFIYLANAVNDLRADGPTLALVLAPLVFLSALCVLPDAINIQHAVAEHFTPGARHVGWMMVQERYAPAADDAKTLIPGWIVATLNLVALLMAFLAHLLVLISLRRLRSGLKEPQLLAEVVATWREALKLLPSFFWIAILQVVVPAAALFLWTAELVISTWYVAFAVLMFEAGFLVVGGLIYLWLYFSEYALVFENQYSFRALLRSRDLLRKQFFRVAIRIVVFLAVWSGYDSWAAGLFLMVSWVLGPVGFLTGYFWSVFFVVEFAGVAVTYMLSAFFMIAGYRLFQDLVAIIGERGTEGAVQPTLGDPTSSAAGS
ncbi:MAG TPA: hypothetical protein VMT61_16805 [Candidatus Binataceae bacterium]|nr:hypothetical protein [Candidatus Binataceae bacterium]